MTQSVCQIFVKKTSCESCVFVLEPSRFYTGCDDSRRTIPIFTHICRTNELFEIYLYIVYVNRVGFLCRLWFLNISPNLHPSFERVIHRPWKLNQHRFEAVKDFFDHCFVRGMLGTSSSSPHNKTLHVCCIYLHLPPKLPKCRQIDRTLIQCLE